MPRVLVTIQVVNFLHLLRPKTNIARSLGAPTEYMIVKRVDFIKVFKFRLAFVALLSMLAVAAAFIKVGCNFFYLFFLEKSAL
jgi:hypothetical protein